MSTPKRSSFADIPVAELAALDEANLAQDEEVRRTGRFVDAWALESVDEEVTIGVRDGMMSAIDGLLRRPPSNLEDVS